MRNCNQADKNQRVEWIVFGIIFFIYYFYPPTTDLHTLINLVHVSRVNSVQDGQPSPPYNPAQVGAPLAEGLAPLPRR